MVLDFHGQLPPLGEAQILWDVVEEHLEEASFLWTEWERALVSPAFTLASTIGLERRLVAHLEGLALGGAISPERLGRSAVRAGDAGSIFAAAHALLHRGLDGGAGAAEDLLAMPAGERREAARRAFELAPGGAGGVDRIASADRPPVRAALLDRARAAGVDPGAALDAALGDPDGEVRRAALGLAAAGARHEHRDAILALLGDADPAVRSEAFRAGMILGVAEAIPACRRAVEAGPGAPGDLLLLGLSGAPADVAILLAALDSPERRGAALFALGFTRSIEGADACAAAVDDAAHGTVAAEAFAGITGIDLVQRGLGHPAPPPLADLEDAPDLALALRPEMALPRPDPARLRAFWTASRPAFTPRSAEPAALLELLGRAPMRRRHALAIELAVATRGAVVLDTRTWARAQLATIERLGATGAAS